MIITPASSLRGEILIPGDKSISHRSVILGAISSGTCNISNFLMSDDCLATINCFKKMGVNIEISGNNVCVHGVGMRGLSAPNEVLYTANSGTTTRLLCGLLSAQNFSCILDGDSSIRTRPMARVTKPLAIMGADITARDGDFCPLEIHGKKLHGIEYTLPIASAQLKSAIILAALYADGKTIIHENTPSRNHTENMLKALDAPVTFSSNSIEISKTTQIKSFDFSVPGDISSAAFFIVAGLIVPNSELILRNVGINETRRGIIDLLIKMGANIELLSVNETLEPCCDMRVRSSALHGIDICGEIIPNVIDELPIIAVAAAYADGITRISDASELRHKESDRISAMCTELKKCGADVSETDDGMIIKGGYKLHGADFDSHNDHRIAMSMAVCALSATSPSSLSNEACVNISYPQFFSELEKIRG